AELRRQAALHPAAFRVHSPPERHGRGNAHPRQANLAHARVAEWMLQETAAAAMNVASTCSITVDTVTRRTPGALRVAAASHFCWKANTLSGALKGFLPSPVLAAGSWLSAVSAVSGTCSRFQFSLRCS